MLRRFKVLGLLLVSILMGATAVSTNANAIVGGSSAGHLRGQVQFWVSGKLQCGGTLIGSNWVLTAKHCVTDNGATVNNIKIYAGSRLLSLGHEMSVSGIYLNANADAALLKLSQDVPNWWNVVVGYGSASPMSHANVAISGWGNTSSGPEGGRPAIDLQIASMTVARESFNVPAVGNGNIAVVYTDHGAGHTEFGDSGAGIWYGNEIVGIHLIRDGNNNDGYGVLTEYLATWIQNTSGIASS